MYLPVFSLKSVFPAEGGDANVLSHFGGCRTRRICSGKCPSNSFAIPRLTGFRLTSGYPKCSSSIG
jgi:hypothetical protein